MNKQKTWKYAVLCFISLLFVCLMILTLWKPVIMPSLDTLQHPVAFEQWLSTFGWYARMIMIVCAILKVIFPVLPGKVLEIAAGYCFGFMDALMLLLIANAIGTWIVHTLIKQYGMHLVERFISKETKEEFPLWKDEERFTVLLWITYLIPGTPKDALTYVISLSNMNTGKLVFITTAARSFTVASGVLSGTALYANEFTTFLWISAGFAILSLSCTYCFRKYLHKK